MKYTSILLSFFLFLSCSSNENTVFPDDEWEVSTPEKQGLNPGKLSEAILYLEEHSKHNGVKELVVIRNGYVVYDGPQTDSVHNIWSCSKTFTSTVLGLLVDKGRLDLDDRAAEYEPLLKEFYPDVSFRHFTTMTSGYNAVGESRWKDTDYDDWSWTVYDPAEPQFLPGEAYAYWDEAMMMFGRVLTRVLGKSMKDYLTENLTDKIGMGEWYWYPEDSLDQVPINNGSTNVFINAKQFARWGWLFLNKGQWDGDQILSEEWVRMATSVQVPANLPTGDTDRRNVVGSGCYGFNWWVNGKMANEDLQLPEAPEGCYYASGLNNNKCIVIPEWNMVIVRMGEDGHPQDKERVYGTFLAKMGEAIDK